MGQVGIKEGGHWNDRLAVYLVWAVSGRGFTKPQTTRRVPLASPEKVAGPSVVRCLLAGDLKDGVLGPSMGGLGQERRRGAG